MGLSRESKGYIACFLIFAIIVFTGFIKIGEQQNQIKSLQKDAKQREIIQQSSRYDNCLLSNAATTSSNELNASLYPAIIGLARLADGAQKNDQTSEYLKKVATFIDTQPLSKCYKPEGYIKSD